MLKQGAMTDIRSLRLSKKVSQRNLAEKLGISVLELSKIERCLVSPSVTILETVAHLLGTNSVDLYETHHHLAAQTRSGEGYTTAVSKERFSLPRRVQITEEKYSILDLFCGTGGFSHGFEQTGQFQVTAALDLLPDRVRTFSENHPAAEMFCADIQKFALNLIEPITPQPHIVIGGPPCQGFSSIRPFRTLTERDARNNLLESFAVAVDHFRPEWFVLENVVGLLTHQQGETFQALLHLFEQIGYGVDWKILNAACYGLPQRRERLILVGNRQGKKFVWPEPTHMLPSHLRSMAGKKHDSLMNMPLFGTPLPSAITVMEAIHDLPEIAAGEHKINYRDDIELTDYELMMRGHETELTLHEATAHSPHMLEIIKQAGNSRNELPIGLTTSGFSSSYSRLEPDIPSVTLTVNFVHPASNKCIHPYQHRALTPREGARLQGFEDAYRFMGTRTQIVKQIGNAVPPILGRAISEALLKQL